MLLVSDSDLVVSLGRRDLALAQPRETEITSFYGYIPTKWICILFLVLFSLSSLIHLTQAITHRTWWLIPTACFCGVLEILGWSARLWSSFEPALPEPYEMQITCTIIAPTPLIAANFVILGRVIELLGEGYSRVGSRMYSIIFVTCDIISLVIQGVGGGLAATAVQFDKSPVKGGRIMLGGIAFQLAVISVYITCGTEFFIRYFHDTPIQGSSSRTSYSYSTNGVKDGDSEGTRSPGSPGSGITTRRRRGRGVFSKRIKVQVGGLVLMGVCLWIRSVYRTIELANGWTGRIITTQVYFNVLDGAMVVLALFGLNFANPGYLIRVDKGLGVGGGGVEGGIEGTGVGGERKGLEG